MLYETLKPVLFWMDPEVAHDWALGWARRFPGLGRLWTARPSSALAQTFRGTRYAHPLGLAAGMDKDGLAIPFWGHLGFGFCELGTVTPNYGQPGNQKPRLYRQVPDLAIINQMGSNNRGAIALAARLTGERSLPCAVSIGKARATTLDGAAQDYASCAAVLGKVSPAYIAINISSPNTANLRTLQTTAHLTQIVAAVRRNAPGVPVAVKFSPDCANSLLVELATACVELGVDYLIAVNTAVTAHRLIARAEGGVSGRPLLERAEEVTRILFKAVGRMIPIIGVGGITDAATAWRRILYGASLIQVYTGLVYRGPALVREIVEGLDQRLSETQTQRLEDQIGRVA